MSSDKEIKEVLDNHENRLKKIEQFLFGKMKIGGLGK